MALRGNLVSKQYNSPINLYSNENVKEALHKQKQVLANGAVGVDFHNLAKPGNLANSAVLRMLEEEERSGRKDPYDPWIERYLTHSLEGSMPTVDREKIKKWSVRPPRRLQWSPTPSPTFKGSVRLSPGLKRVAWPPPPEEDENNSAVFQDPVYSQGPTPAAQVTPPIRQAPDSPQPARRQLEQPIYHPVQFEPPKTTVTLRSTPPVNQQPAPVYQAQPPVASVQGGARMRGDQKWPPESIKQQTAAENEARVALAKGPAFRPRKVKKDYSSFFAQHALNSTYPGYKAPPGTQHYSEGTSNL
ncbi:unnamed protein product [Nezara viridula]|uniref:Zasp-like motif domain-containing protein n=1 Tax=Nezara viridula TaxID=85310 RepID=A0A9P0HTS7_NEZVI|nr:unnamed protein product [Nezara viridula]